ncbi:putative E3 ubiquitin-protein ligase XERICO [Cardamine amara subsp. amara]|uniref:E3 ubiquitin-protein ligase XERICO n=1 Tax=Cardamine amara subsp. amara TaxID=228776 RepID=A0ABD0ZHD4_CARAN
MGLSHFPTASEGVLPLLVMNTVVSVTLLKNMVRSVFQIVGYETEEASWEIEENDETEEVFERRRVSITQFKSLCENRGEEEEEVEVEEKVVECCVCLCGFKEEEEVSELVSCKHFFHRGCLDKWFGNDHTTCPLCRTRRS